MPAHFAILIRATCLLFDRQAHLHGVTSRDRFEEPQIFQTCVGQNGPFVWLNKHTRRKGQKQIAMCYPAREERIARGGVLICVGIERVTGELGKMLDVFQ